MVWALKVGEDNKKEGIENGYERHRKRRWVALKTLGSGYWRKKAVGGYAVQPGLSRRNRRREVQRPLAEEGIMVAADWGPMRVNVQAGPYGQHRQTRPGFGNCYHRKGDVSAGMPVELGKGLGVLQQHLVK